MAFSAPTVLTTQSLTSQGTGTSTSASVTFPSGSLGLIGVLLTDPAAGVNTTAPTITDSSGNTWTLADGLGSTQGGQNWRMGLYYQYFSSGATCTVSLNPNAVSANTRLVWIGYVSGSTTTPFDVAAHSNVNGTALGAATTAARTADNELGFVIYISQGTGTNPSPWPTSGFTSLTSVVNGTSDVLGIEYQIYTGGNGSTATTGSVTGAANNAEGFVIGTFKPAVANPPVLMGGGLVVYMTPTGFPVTEFGSRTYTGFGSPPANWTIGPPAPGTAGLPPFLIDRLRRS